MISWLKNIKNYLVEIYEIRNIVEEQRKENQRICAMLEQQACSLRNLEVATNRSLNNLMITLKNFQNNWQIEVMRNYEEVESYKIAEHVNGMLQLLKVKKVAESSGKLCRTGQSNDGGYLILDGGSENKIAYSFGINDDVCWDKDMAGRGVEVYMYDHTIDGLPEENDKFHWQKIGLTDTFDGKHPELHTLPQILEDNGHINEKHMILKMDIEGAEWNVFAGMSDKYLTQFDQIVIEFHALNNIANYDVMEKALLNLNKFHQLVHVHGNNNENYTMIAGKVLPDVIECTYIKKDICEFVSNDRNLPDRLDDANNQWVPDIFLGKYS